MKLVLLLGPGANQRALAHRLAACSPIAALVHVSLAGTAAPPKGSKFPAMARRLARGLAGLPLRRAWFAMMAGYDRRYPDWPTEPRLTVADVNDPAIAELLGEIGPDLIVVSGTNLLRKPLIEAADAAGARIMNLHTGISPYVRGGPNCTSWCLSTGQFDLIGNSVMWIDAGIDSGNLVATERTPLSGGESLAQLHEKVMDHAHGLLLRCVRRFAEGKPLPDVPQQGLGQGQLFLTRHWTAAAAAKAVANFYRHYRKAVRRPPRAGVTLVSPEG